VRLAQDALTLGILGNRGWAISQGHLPTFTVVCSRHERRDDVRALGRCGLLVSRVGLGTMNFGYTVDEQSSFAVMDAAIDAGSNFFDTADVYGGPQSPHMAKRYGIAEETVGRWLQRSGHRDDIVLATKGVPAVRVCLGEITNSSRDVADPWEPT
jgi:aryl-alcohol dehydrogenase-like predicted oxidoreductase